MFEILCWLYFVSLIFHMSAVLQHYMFLVGQQNGYLALVPKICHWLNLG